MARRNKYVDEAKELSDQGKIAEAVPLLKKAQEIIQTDKNCQENKADGGIFVFSFRYRGGPKVC